jgi:hypothetical protein
VVFFILSQNCFNIYSMKFLKRFEEINPKDIAFITSNLDNYFTIAFEFEIETDDESGYEYDFSEIDDDLIEEVHDEVRKELKIRTASDKKFLRDLCDLLLEYIDDESLNKENFDQIFSNDFTDSQKTISNHLQSVLKSQIIANDFYYLKSKAEEFLPDFIHKWGEEIEFIQDVTLDRGIEIKNKSYVVSISKSIQMIEDFYQSLNAQQYWKLDTTTGLHINIGSTQDIKWNPLKGLLLMNDYSKTPEQVPLVFKDMTWRLGNKYCGSLFEAIFRMTALQRQNIKKNIDFQDLEKTELELNKFLNRKIIDDGIKNFGFNITRLSNNYVEFRYAGGVLPKSVLIDKLKYFCFLVYCMTNVNYKRKDYLNKLYKFASSL